MNRVDALAEFFAAYAKCCKNTPGQAGWALRMCMLESVVGGEIINLRSQMKKLSFRQGVVDADAAFEELRNGRVAHVLVNVVKQCELAGDNIERDFEEILARAAELDGATQHIYPATH